MRSPKTTINRVVVVAVLVIKNIYPTGLVFVCDRGERNGQTTNNIQDTPTNDALQRNHRSTNFLHTLLKKKILLYNACMWCTHK